MKKKVISAVAIVCALSIGGITYYNKTKQPEVNATFAMNNTANLVTTAKNGDITSSISASGTVAISDTNTCYSGTSQTIDEIFVKEGDTVNAGDVILTYKTEDAIKNLESQIKQKEIERLEVGVKIMRLCVYKEAKK